MAEKISLYKEISLQIVESLENEEIYIIEELLNKRQEILDKQIDNNEFKFKLINEGIIDIDRKIEELLKDSMSKVKQEIKEYRLSKQVNNSYMNYNNKNLNIFNKKV
ncbi:flagellar protein FliT [Terrisporobacter petrolearius]|uniref:flagellar protein FliT n=1 Tax=Terrisporobacter petrolearius TaxID=1460447 RepID=UPI001D15F78E|nr:flagellar protein FliT [Terrisporobacter petrolearius]MCC3862832.1 flagellar protein FliT [Terrisporobacter petrolearius]